MKISKQEVLHVAHLARLELQTVLAVVDPGAVALDVLAGGDAGRGTDHGHQIALTPHLDA